MTKEEYEDFVLRYKGCGACFPLYHKLSRFEKMWFTAIQKDVAELEKENAELKGIKDVATLIRANNDTVVTLMQLNNELVSKRQQLTEAKEIIKIMRYLLFDVWGYIAIPFEKRVNNFLKQSNL